MLTVRSEQMMAMAEAIAIERFEPHMIRRLRTLFPEHTSALRKSGVRRCVRLGIQRARVYGITNPRQLQFYIVLMFLFGSRFDTDPLYPWAARILHEDLPLDVPTRIGRLQSATLDYLSIVHGPDGSFVTTALDRLLHVELNSLPHSLERRFERDAIDLLERIHPQRHAYLGDGPILQMLRRSRDMAKQLNLDTPEGIVLTAGLMLTVGHGWSQDPLYPWLSSDLERRESPAQRVNRLHRRVMRYLRLVLDYRNKTIA